MRNDDYILSTKEVEILLLISEGKKNHEIAEILFISHRTVEAHKAHICRKLNLKTTAELTCYAVSNKALLEKNSELT